MSPTPFQILPAVPEGSLEAKLLRAAGQTALLRPAPVQAGGLLRLGRFLRDLGRPVPRGPLALADALPWLVPKVRQDWEYALFAEQSRRPAPCHRPLAGSFAVSLAVDLPTQELDLGEAELAAWGMGLDALLPRARSNLAAREPGLAFEPVAPGCFRSPWRDGLDASRLLLPGMIERLALKGDPVAFLPDHDTLLVAGADDPDALRWALERMPSTLREGPIRLRHGRWEPFDYPPCSGFRR